MHLWRRYPYFDVPLRGQSFRRNRGILALFLFYFNTLAALLLGGLVWLAPRFVQETTGAHGWQKILVLFAHDIVVRRVAIAASLGLFVTACICFWPNRGRRPSRSNRKRIRPVAGA